MHQLCNNFYGLATCNLFEEEAQQYNKSYSFFFTVCVAVVTEGTDLLIPSLSHVVNNLPEHGTTKHFH